MTRVSRERILAPARAVNPKVKIIIKYPQWYDQFHNRGYDVVVETADFDRTWVGTETRDYEDKQWGGDVQYKGYYLMRWLGESAGQVRRRCSTYAPRNTSRAGPSTVCRPQKLSLRYGSSCTARPGHVAKSVRSPAFKWARW
jgi:hypothetical protein